MVKWTWSCSLCLIGVICMLPDWSFGSDISSDELQQLRSLVIQQQKMIEELRKNQEQQAEEIANLKNLLEKEKHADKQQIVEAPQSEDVGADSDTLSPRIMPSGMVVSLGAHINRAINIVDDGANTEAYFVDNSNYPTLLYVKGSKDLNDDVTVGGVIEYAIQQNAATSVSQDNQDSGLDITSRFFELTADSNRYGKFWLGRGFMSSFLAVEIDKSETWRYNLISPGNSFGGIKFVNTEDDSLTDIPVNLVFIDVEAFSFRDRLRYDSPSWYGVQLSGSAGSGNSNDITLRWNRQLGDFDLTAGASIQNNPLVGRIDERLDGGLGIYHTKTGLNFTFGAFQQDYVSEFNKDFNRVDSEATGWVTRLGLRRNWFDLGETRTAIDFSRAENILYDDDTADSFGLFVGQMIDDLNLEFYAGYRYYSFEPGPQSGGPDVYDIHAVTAGARILFDATFTGVP